MSSEADPKPAAGRRAVVTAIGLTCPLGDSPEAFFEALCRGESGLGEITAFDTEGLEARRAGEIRDFDPVRYFGRANFRPLDRTARLATVAAHLALEASGWSREAREEQELGLVLGTMFGSVHTISAFDCRALEAGPIYAKPLDFANSVINAAAGQTAIWHDLRGVNSTVAGGTAAGLLALASGADAIRTGRAEALLAGGAEELCFESFYGFLRAGMLAPSANGGPPPVPFGAASRGFALAEGACLLMLEEESLARSRGAAVLAEIAGHGASFDPSRGADPEAAAAAVARAIRAALADAGLGPEEIDIASLSASGRPGGDRAEALGVAEAFGPRVERMPVMAVKGQLGEALGASGALQAAALVSALGSGRVPGIPGLGEGTPLGGAHAETRPFEGRAGLVLALGLDGQVAAAVLRRPGGTA